MNPKMLGMLAIAGAAFALLAFLNQPGEIDSRDEMTGNRLFVGELTDVKSVALASAAQKVTLEAVPGGWVVVEKERYPVDFGKLASFLNSLADAKFVERKTTRADNFAALGVANLDAPDSTAILLTVEGAGNPFKALVGNASQGIAGVYLRKPDEDQVWLVSGLGQVLAEPAGWIERVVINIDSEHITRVTQRSLAGAELVAVRNEESTDFRLPGLPAGAELKYATVANTLGRALVNVRIEDVRARAADAWDAVATAEYLLDDGSVVMVRTRRVDDQNWIRVELTPATEPSAAVTGIDRDRLQAFEYRVGATVADQFTRGMSDMIKTDEPDAG